MKFPTFFDIFRLYVISPEALVIALSGAMVILYPGPAAFFGSEVSREGSLLQYIALLPIALLSVTFKLSKELLKPLDGANNRTLYEWPDYWRLKNRALAAIFFCLISSAGALGLWVFKTHLHHRLLGAGLIAAVVLALVSTMSLYLGYLRLREILQGGS
jgi:hypothetical protein